MICLRTWDETKHAVLWNTQETVGVLLINKVRVREYFQGILHVWCCLTLSPVLQSQSATVNRDRPAAEFQLH